MIYTAKNFVVNVVNRLSFFRQKKNLSIVFTLILWTASSAHAQVLATSQSASNNWNRIFEKAPGTPYGWSGGDGAMSIPLPYCADCPTDKYRHLWFFGDSALSTVSTGTSGNNFRVDGSNQRGADLLGGNTIAITSHSATSDYSANSVMFDWGATGTKPYPSWMPLLIDTNTLADMNDLRLAANGYNSLNFSNDGAIAKVYATSPDPFNSDIVPIYEYYNPFVTSNDYSRDLILNGAFGLVYRGIAFYANKTKLQPDMIPLYRYYSSDVTDVLLSTSATVNGNGYTDRETLGYVFPATNTTTGTAPLFQYFRTTAFYNFHHAYTTTRNDGGKEIAMWPTRGIVIGNDLVYLFAPVTNSDTAPWNKIDTSLVAIIPGVNRPYPQWGKTLKGNWSTPPKQYQLIYSDARTSWGIFLMKDANYATNKYIYVYGSKNGQLVVARVACSTASDFVKFSNWRFYSNGTWVTSQENTTPILNWVGPDFTIHRSPNGRFVIVYSETWWISAYQIAFASGWSPTGPFNHVSANNFDLSTYVNEQNDYYKYTYYAANGHEGLAPDGSLLISYVRSCQFSGDDACTVLPSDKDLSSVYVPRFVTVPWTDLDRD